MAMFIGKISSKRKTGPRKISNALPKGIVVRDGKFYKVSEGSQEVALSTDEPAFNDFFGLKKEDQKETASCLILATLFLGLLQIGTITLWSSNTTSHDLYSNLYSRRGNGFKSITRANRRETGLTAVKARR